LVGVLAALHGRFYGQTDLDRQFPWLRTYPDRFTSGYEAFGLRRFHEKAMVEAVDVIPADITARREEIWPAQLASLAAHRSQPTLIHGDVHLGNWYITGAGRMGLCDWSAVSIGCWARDFAYAVASTLTIEDRRAWEADLLGLYLARMKADHGVDIAFDDAWRLYRQQMPAALLMWTVTLRHSPLMPDMQPRHVAVEMVRRMTQAMSDLATLDSF
jgi:aminoglycoside phosphotransferase (APT) family kinase protein